MVLRGQKSANLDSLIKPDGEYTQSTNEPLQLLLDEHFTGTLKQERIASAIVPRKELGVSTSNIS